MSLRSLDLMRKKISFRLTFWYFTIFVGCSIALFAGSYFLISASLRDGEHSTLLAKAKDLEALYRAGGLIAIRNDLKFERYAGRPNVFFVRLASPLNRSVFLSLPDDWTDFDLKALEKKRFDNDAWTQLGAGDNKDVLEIYTIRLNDGFILQVGKNNAARNEILNNFYRVLLAVLVPVLGLAFVGGHFMTVRFLRPVRELVQTVRSISDNVDIQERAPVSQNGDELDELAILFNQMLDRIETLVQSMKETLDNVAHDLRTPMTRWRGMAEMALQARHTDENSRDALVQCIEESENILKILQTLMDISEAENGLMRLEIRPTNISSILEDVEELYQYVAEEKQISVTQHFPLDLMANCDPNRTRQVFANLMDNAIKYTQMSGTVEIEAHREPPFLVIRIWDTGIGISSEDLPRIWDRMYRGDKSRSQRGLGLGLSLVKAIIRAHGGQIEALSVPGSGSVFTVYLPQ
jgi:signal transduction histidine kinase